MYVRVVKWKIVYSFDNSDPVVKDIPHVVKLLLLYGYITLDSPLVHVLLFLCLETKKIIQHESQADIFLIMFILQN